MKRQSRSNSRSSRGAGDKELRIGPELKGSMKRLREDIAESKRSLEQARQALRDQTARDERSRKGGSS